MINLEGPQAGEKAIQYFASINPQELEMEDFVVILNAIVFSALEGNNGEMLIEFASKLESASSMGLNEQFATMADYQITEVGLRLIGRHNDAMLNAFGSYESIKALFSGFVQGTIETYAVAHPEDEFWLDFDNMPSNCKLSVKMMDALELMNNPEAAPKAIGDSLHACKGLYPEMDETLQMFENAYAFEMLLGED